MMTSIRLKLNKYSTMMMFLTIVIVLSFGGILYTNHTNKINDHRWCELLRLTYNNTPSGKDIPPGKAGVIVEYRKKLQKLLREFDCN